MPDAAPEPAPDAAPAPPDAPEPAPEASAPATAAEPERAPEPIGSLGRSAAEVTEAPDPRAASGVEIGASRSFARHLIWVPRAILFVPRWAFWLVAQPIRLGAWAYERYQLGYLYKHGIINIDDTFGITPTASYGGGFGLQAGVRIVHRDLFGDQERLRLSAGFGGQYSLGLGARLSSGDRFGDVLEVGLEARYERRPHDRFYGIGNGDQPDPPPTMLIDPATDPTAVRSRYRQTVSSAALVTDLHITRELGLRLTGELVARDFGTDATDPRSIELHYDVDRLVGFDGGLHNVYVEGELRYDSRRRTSIYQSHAMDATGWFAAAYFGGATGWKDDRTDYLRYGGELQRYFDLYRGSRVLAFRVLVETVAGTDGLTDGEIVFVDLPTLGGTDDLRGFPVGRFRDRALTLGSAEYTWDLGNYLAAFLFTDVGRVWHDLRDFDFVDFRFGYGGGLQIQTRSSFVARAQVAASEEDIFFQLSFSPAYGRRERAGRY